MRNEVLTTMLEIFILFAAAAFIFLVVIPVILGTYDALRRWYRHYKRQLALVDEVYEEYHVYNTGRETA